MVVPRTKSDSRRQAALDWIWGPNRAGFLSEVSDLRTLILNDYHAGYGVGVAKGGDVGHTPIIEKFSRPGAAELKI